MTSFYSLLSSSTRSKAPINPSAKSAPPTPLEELNTLNTSVQKLWEKFDDLAKKTSGKKLEDLEFSVLYDLTTRPKTLLERTEQALKRVQELASSSKSNQEVRDRASSLTSSFNARIATAQNYQKHFAYTLPFIQFFKPVYEIALAVQKKFWSAEDKLFDGQTRLDQEATVSKVKKFTERTSELAQQMKKTLAELQGYRSQASKEMQPFAEQAIARYQKQYDSTARTLTNFIPFLEFYVPHFEKMSGKFLELKNHFIKILDPTRDAPISDEECNFAETKFKEFADICRQGEVILANCEKGDDVSSKVKAQIKREKEHINDLLSSMKTERDFMVEWREDTKLSNANSMADTEDSNGDEEVENSPPSLPLLSTPQNQHSPSHQEVLQVAQIISPTGPISYQIFFSRELAPSFFIGVDNPRLRAQSLAKIKAVIKASIQDKDLIHLYAVVNEVSKGKITSSASMIDKLTQSKPPVAAFLPLVNGELINLEKTLAGLREMIEGFVDPSVYDPWLKSWESEVELAKALISDFERRLSSGSSASSNTLSSSSVSFNVVKHDAKDDARLLKEIRASNSAPGWFKPPTL